MNKILYTTLAGLMGIQITLSLPLYAQTEQAEETTEEKVIATEEMSDTEMEVSENTDFKGFTIQHTINDGALPEEQIEADPLVLLSKLKTDIQAQIEALGKPLTISTEIKPIVDKDIETGLNGVPVLTISTNIAEDGSGKSDFNVPSWERVLPADEESGEINLSWKGLTGDMAYGENFAKPAFNMIVSALNFQEVGDDGVKIELAESSMSGQLDADMMPVKIAFALPKFAITDTSSNLSVNELSINANTEVKTLSGEGMTEGSVNLSTGTVKVSKLELKDQEEGINLLLDAFELVGKGDVDGSWINYTLSSSIAKLLVDGMDEDKIDVSYQDSWSLNRLNVDSVARIQKQLNMLQKQHQSGMMSEDMMGMALIGTLMQELPNLLQASPELAANKVLLTTQHGKFDAMASLSIDGSKPFNMQDMNAVIQVLKASADVKIDEGLLKEVFIMQARSEMPEDQEIDEATLTAMVDQQIQRLTEGKLLVKDGEQYLLKATMEGGKLLVNGQEMPLPM